MIDDARCEQSDPEEERPHTIAPGLRILIEDGMQELHRRENQHQNADDIDK